MSSCYNGNDFVRICINRIVPHVRHYDLDIIGDNNIPRNTNALYVINHSNARDFFTMQEMFKKLRIKQSFMASNEDLNSVILYVFKSCGGILFNRSDKYEAQKAFDEMLKRLRNGICGAIFPEATWNLHPYKPMHLMKVGATKLALYAHIPVVPVIFEYVEVPYCCSRERDIFSKCIIKIGEPISILDESDILEQTNIIQSQMETSRLELWKKLGINKNGLENIDINVYLNHLYLKKFGGAGEYDTVREMRYLFSTGGLSCENEYCIDENGVFAPGILTKEEGKKYVSY